MRPFRVAKVRRASLQPYEKKVPSAAGDKHSKGQRKKNSGIVAYNGVHQLADAEKNGRLKLSATNLYYLEEPNIVRNQE